jgi:DMSO/TMAO reductase YedYZ molybdopterin-dependent catalytic subunit
VSCLHAEGSVWFVGVAQRFSEMFISYDVCHIVGAKMHTKRRLVTVLLIIGIVLSVAVNLPIATLYATDTEPTDLGEVEIREYEGQDLSSVDAFRENSIKGPQYIDIETYKLNITGLVNNELEYTYDEVIDSHQSYKKVVTLNCVEGWRATILWEGVLVKDLIADAGVDPSANTVIFYAYDGYSTSLPLDYIIDNNIMIAYKMNNVTMPPERGYPFELVAESKWGYKWIKWVTTIELSDDAEYKGFWESRGWPNDGTITSPPGGNTGGGIPEFPSWIILPLFLATTLFVVVFRKKIFTSVR